MTVIEFPNVRKGDRDEEGTNVRKIQYLLREHGYTLGVDGIFGPETDDRVRKYQQSNGLAVDGVVGQNTWSKLIVEVQQASKGDAVRAVQSQFSFLAVDGDFGPLTDAAVREFQRRANTYTDGIVGPYTWLILTQSPIVSEPY